MHRRHLELHYAERIGWLRAAVLGANDGMVSTASLVVGVAAANAARGDVLIAGVAGGSVSVGSLVFLALMGVLAARAGGASVAIGASRVTLWGALAMAIMAAVGAMFGNAP